MKKPVLALAFITAIVCVVPHHKPQSIADGNTTSDQICGVCRPYLFF